MDVVVVTGARPAKDLQAVLGISLTAVIQHLGVLEQSGLVQTEKSGRTRTCQLAPEGLAVAARWIEERQAFWARRLDRLGELLDEEAGEANPPGEPGPPA